MAEDNEDWVRDLLPRFWVPIGSMGILYCVQGILVDRIPFVPRFNAMLFIKLDNFNASSIYWSDKVYTETHVRRALYSQIYWTERQYREAMTGVS